MGRLQDFQKYNRIDVLFFYKDTQSLHIHAQGRLYAQSDSVILCDSAITLLAKL